MRRQRDLSGEDPLEIVCHLRGVLVPVVGMLLHRLHHHRFEPERDVGVVPGRRLRGFANVLVGDRHRSLAHEGRSPGEQLIHDHPERVQVAAPIGDMALGLLRAEVGSRPDHRSGAGELFGVVEGAGDAEVGDLHGAVGGEQDVRRLDVAMHQTLGVCCGEGRGHLESDLGDPAGLEHAFGAEDVAQVLALNELHHHEVGAVVLAPVVNRHDAGVGEIRCSLGLPTEALDKGIAGGELPVEDLDSDVAAEASVEGDVHVRHTAAGDMGDEGVAIRQDAL